MRNFGSKQRTDLDRLNAAIGFVCNATDAAFAGKDAAWVCDYFGVRKAANRAKVADAMKGRLG